MLTQTALQQEILPETLLETIILQEILLETLLEVQQEILLEQITEHKTKKGLPVPFFNCLSDSMSRNLFSMFHLPHECISQ